MAKGFTNERCVSAYTNTNALQIINLPKLTVIYEYTKLLGLFPLVFVTKIKARELMINKKTTIDVIIKMGRFNLEEASNKIP